MDDYSATTKTTLFSFNTAPPIALPLLSSPQGLTNPPAASSSQQERTVTEQFPLLSDMDFHAHIKARMEDL
jgi:hypothetical protein